MTEGEELELSELRGEGETPPDALPLPLMDPLCDGSALFDTDALGLVDSEPDIVNGLVVGSVVREMVGESEG